MNIRSHGVVTSSVGKHAPAGPFRSDAHTRSDAPTKSKQMFESKSSPVADQWQLRTRVHSDRSTRVSRERVIEGSLTRLRTLFCCAFLDIDDELVLVLNLLAMGFHCSLESQTGDLVTTLKPQVYIVQCWSAMNCIP